MTSNQILNFYKFIREIHSNFNDKIDQTEVITTRLKSHQLNAVNWMLHKDKTGICEFINCTVPLYIIVKYLLTL